MVDRVHETLVHGLVAAAVLSTLLRLWAGDAPGLRLRLRLLAIAFPALITPAFWLLFPHRSSGLFGDEVALFSTARLGDLRLVGYGVDRILGLALSLAGTVLFMRDLLPFVLEQHRARGGPQGGRTAPDLALVAAARDAAAAMNAPPPEVVCVAGDGPILLTTGFWRPRVLASRSLLERLTPNELRAAMAHEMVHARHRDPLLGWVLMGLRGILFFNPAVQVVARAAVQDLERRADVEAVAVTHDAEALASGLEKSFRGGEGRRATARGILGLEALGRLIDDYRPAVVKRRCHLLREPPPAGPDPWGLVRFSLTTGGLAVLLYFVV